MLSSLKEFYTPTKVKVLGLIIYYVAVFSDSMIRVVYYRIVLANFFSEQTTTMQMSKELTGLDPQDTFKALFLQNFLMSTIGLLIFYTAVCLLVHLGKRKKYS